MVVKYLVSTFALQLMSSHNRFDCCMTCHNCCFSLCFRSLLVGMTLRYVPMCTLVYSWVSNACLNLFIDVHWSVIVLCKGVAWLVIVAHGVFLAMHCWTLWFHSFVITVLCFVLLCRRFVIAVHVFVLLCSEFQRLFIAFTKVVVSFYTCSDRFANLLFSLRFACAPCLRQLLG